MPSDPLLQRDRYSNHSNQRQLETVKSVRQVWINQSRSIKHNPIILVGSLSRSIADFMSSRSDAWSI